MTDRDDHRLVELLYDDEAPPEEAAKTRAQLRGDEAAASSLAAMEATLRAVRSVPNEDPPAYLDAKILAEARRVAQSSELTLWARLRRSLVGSPSGLVLAGAVAAVAAVLVIPSGLLQRASEPPVAIELRGSEDLSGRALAPAPAAEAPAADRMVRIPPTEAPRPSDSDALAQRRSKRAAASGSVRRDERRAAPPAAAAPPARGLALGSGGAKEADRLPAAGEMQRNRRVRVEVSGPAPVKSVGVASGARASAEPMADAASGTRAEPESKSATTPAAAKPKADNAPAEVSSDGVVRARLDAARTKERARQFEAARNDFRVAQRLAIGRPILGVVLVRFAEFELRQKNYKTAKRLAETALKQPRLQQRGAAETVIRAVDAQPTVGADSVNR